MLFERQVGRCCYVSNRELICLRAELWRETDTSGLPIRLSNLERVAGVGCEWLGIDGV